MAKKSQTNIKAKVAKWSATGAWAIPASGIAEIVKMIVRHLLK